MHDVSPGVGRAVAAAEGRAEARGAAGVRLADLVLGLLDEDEGRPAGLVDRLGRQLAEVREALATLRDETNPLAPPTPTLLAAARAWSLGRRADPAVMTDALFLVVLRVDPAFAAAAARLGLDPAAIDDLLTSPDDPVAPPGDTAAAFALPDPTDEHDAARVVDANLNRGREALRVLEDYVRFVLDDRFLTEQVKGLRHELAEAAGRLPPGLLLAARETRRDVGTTVSAAGEYDRATPRQVAEVNLKRLQESLRSLEEFGKLFAGDPGRAFEALRYRTYTLERAVVTGGRSREKLADARVYVLLTGSECVASLDWTIERAAAGGATVFQLREKSLSDRELLERARDVRRWTRQAGVLFIVNDRPDIARLAEADGVHLGQDDLPVREARRVVGPDALIGVSTHSVEQVRRAVLDGADYLGVGPTFPSRTKTFEVFPGLDFVRAAAAETSLPAFALGGVGPENVGRVAEAGGRRVAVGAAVGRADDPEPVARVLRAALGGSGP
ncbi:MAG: thiamine phosphate synthase [Gemmataceae bacterium]|nr:thiamine phosphate synthase [Gemmataceae bacterium]